jgi:glyoxylase-like metal-dependent hydrolase (beta-lactamase superfamily II)
VAHTFRAGDLTIHRIVEMEFGFLDAFDMLPDLTPEMLDAERHWFAPTGLDAEGRLQMSFHTYAVRTPHHVVLVDSCIGNDKRIPNRPNWHMKGDDRFMKGLAAVGLTVEDVDFVVCTHLHADHVGWNTRLDNGRWVPTFPNARYVFGDEEYRHWQAMDARSPVLPFQDSVLPVVEAGRADLVGGDHAISDHVRLLPTPGHTPGHVAVLFGKGETVDALATGDLIHTPLQARLTQLSTKFDTDRAQAAVTRRSMLERFCDTRTLCCTAHFPSPSVGRITCFGDGFACSPVEAA